MKTFLNLGVCLKYSLNTHEFSSSFLKALIELGGTTTNSHFLQGVLWEINKSCPADKHSTDTVNRSTPITPISKKAFYSESPLAHEFLEMSCYVLSYNVLK